MIIILREDEPINNTVLMYASVVVKKNKDANTFHVLKNRYDGVHYKELSLDEVLKLQ